MRKFLNNLDILEVSWNLNRPYWSTYRNLKLFMSQARFNN